MKDNTSTPEPTLQDIRFELRHHLAAFSMIVGEIYGDHAVAGVLAYSGPPVRSNWELYALKDLSHLALFAQLEATYDYAFHGYPFTGDHLDVYLEQLHDFLDFFSSSWVEVAYCDSTVQAGIEYVPGGLRKLVELGQARSLLDNEGWLDAKQIALLAGITERSVQNAFSLKGEARLDAEKVSNGYQVSAKEALRWLKGKKGFVPTRERTIAAAGMPWPEEIDTLSGLSDAISTRAVAVLGSGLDLDEFADALGMDSATLRRKMNGSSGFTFEDALPLAKVLQLDPQLLLRQIMQLRHPEEASLLFKN